MASTIDEIEPLIASALEGGYRGRLLERGLARSMIWQDGELPQGAPKFSKSLSYDLLSYGYSLLSLSLRLKELGGNDELCRKALGKSASAILSVVDSGDPSSPERGFHKVLSASAYHLGRYSAKAYSLINRNLDDENLSEIERILCLLILRRFNELETVVIKRKLSGSGADETLASLVNAIGGDSSVKENDISSIGISIIDLAITDNYFSSIFEFILALETGNQALKNSTIKRLETTLSVCSELNLLPQWWVVRITKYLIDDLWNSSFHKLIPFTPEHRNSLQWESLRWLFIASLFKRKKAEIELWPSQIEGATRAVNDSDDLVISLPTSAGKTRIAELCILRTLALGKRILFIAPLRALSAQTEVSLKKTFLPIGGTISTLYGSIGTSDLEQDLLKSKDIVVGTPEKLDFALRNDPTLIDDVGLVILDEGHMIGLNEREIRYETLIQRLLKREDADGRRIVCLSAILPDGDQFDDFVNWLRKDVDGGAVQSDWRPTDLRFGEVEWKGNSGQINFMVGEETPFIPGFVESFVPPHPNPGYRKKDFPNNKKELTLATAWKLLKDDHTVLIYCPQKSSVNSFAKDIIDLYKRGALISVISELETNIELALSLGKEWLGHTHPIVECLKIGVAVHHGNLPTPFRKEMEKLLREGILKITISSPTLAQGLNLSATAVIIYSLYRNKNTIDVSEFENVIGRAGRAFVDTQGIVLHPIFEEYDRNHREWVALISDTNEKNMESGLVLLVQQLLKRMSDSLGTKKIDNLREYVMNNNVWEYPEVKDENYEQINEEKKSWNRHIVNLDTAILSLLGNEKVAIEDIADSLDSILESSLWRRRLNRKNEKLAKLYSTVLLERAKYIWKNSTAPQRRGYFLAGVGLETGRQLDAIATQVNALLVNANIYIMNNNDDAAIATIIQLAEIVFAISPFAPNNLPDNWKSILTCWLQGKTLTEGQFEDIDQTLQFVEDGLIYRLPWGLEAIRVRAGANKDSFDDGTTLEEYKLYLAAPAIEYGTLNRSAAMLMQAGFGSRKAAIRAVESTNANFMNGNGLEAWLNSGEVFVLTNLDDDWPTPETSDLWQEFVDGFQPSSNKKWDSSFIQIPAQWNQNYAAIPSSLVKLWNKDEGVSLVLDSEGNMIGQLSQRYELDEHGIYHAVANNSSNLLDVTYWGAERKPFNIQA